MGFAAVVSLCALAVFAAPAAVNADALTLTAVSAGPWTSPDGWVLASQSGDVVGVPTGNRWEFKYFDGPLDFDDAQAACAAQGGYLATANTQTVNELIFNLAPALPSQPASRRWLGGRRPDAGQPFVWRDGTTETYATTDRPAESCTPGADCGWLADEPNDIDGNENCISMGHPTLFNTNPLYRGGWNDADCSTPRPYVCQRDVTCTRPSEQPNTVMTCDGDGAQFPETVFRQVQTALYGGDACIFECEVGFRGTSGASTCVPQTWDGTTMPQAGNVVDSVASCTLIDCGNLIGGLAPGINVIRDDGTGLDAEVEVECALGYRVLSGDTVYTCTTNGQTDSWTGGGLQCEEIIPCTANPTTGVDGLIAGTCVQIQPGDVCSFTECELGSTGGEWTATCGDNDGMWSVTTTSACAPAMCEGPLPEHSNVDQSSCANPADYGYDCNATCVAGYDDDGSQGAQYFCNANGEWETSREPNCIQVDCPQTPSLDAALLVVPESCANFLFNETCGQFTCVTGYENGGAELLCGADGQWAVTESAACTIKTCEGPPSPEEPFSNSTECADPADYGYGCNATCIPGYDNYDVSTVAEWICNADGEWEVMTPAGCVKRECPQQPLLEIGGDLLLFPNQTCTDYRFQDDCFLDVCEEGYENGGWFAFCEEDGMWGVNQGDPEADACVPVRCEGEKPNQGDHLLRIECAGDPGNEYLDTCVAVCDVGYTGSMTGPGGWTCGADRQWYGAATCTPVDCGATSLANLPDYHPRVNESDFACSGPNGPTEYGSLCSAACVRGYDADDEDGGVWTCTADGVWEGGANCTLVECSSEIPLPRSTPLNFNAQHEIECPYGTEFGDYCTAECKPGFVGCGQWWCSPDGEWWGGASCVPAHCGSVFAGGLDANAMANCGRFDNRIASHDPVDDCVVTCNRGYEGSGSPVYSCNNDAEWVGGDLTCARRQCPTFDAPAGSSVVGSTGDLYQDTIGVTCNIGFVSATAVFTCDVQASTPFDMFWSGEIECVPIMCMDDPDDGIDNANSDCADRNYLADCEVECDAGYVRGNSSNVFTCDANAVWVGDAICVPIQCPVTIANIAAGAEASCPDTFFTDTCTATCAEFHVQTDGVPGYQCSDDGTYINESPYTCTLVDCGTLEVAGADVTCDHTLLGGQCTASCSSDYIITPNSDNTYVCQWIGDEAVWTGGNLTCTLGDCGNFGSPDANANEECSEPSTAAGVTCTSACNTGYDGGSVAYTCTVNGEQSAATWVGGPGPTCARVQCPVTVQPPVASATSDCAGQNLFEDGCLTTCEPGFDSVGDNEHTCQADGTWEATNHECTPITCPASIDEALFSGNCQNTAWGQFCDVTCVAGYEAATEPVQFSCGDEGTWEGEITCERISCPHEIPGEGSSFCNDTRLFEDTCEADCGFGFLSTPDNLVYTCRADGTWGPQAYPVCTPATCPLLDGAGISTSCDGQNIFGGDDCEVSCADGYYANTATLTCGPDGAWLQVFLCEEIRCGPAPEAGANSQRVCSGEDYLNDTCTYQCDRMTQRVVGGTNHAVCDDTGNWQGGGLACEGFCSDLDVGQLNNGVELIGCTGDAEDDVCGLGCTAAGSLVVGDNEMQCKFDGQNGYEWQPINGESCDMICTDYKFNANTDHVYKLFDASLSWADAVNVCAAEAATLGSTNSHLVTIANSAENLFVFNLDSDPNRVRWLGGQRTEQTNNMPFLFQWITMEPFSYANFLPGEPNNNGGEYCLQMHFAGGTPVTPVGGWNDAVCERERNFVCEMDKWAGKETCEYPVPANFVERKGRA